MKGSSVLKILVAVTVISLAMFAAFGCGASGPEAAVEDFLEAGKDKDCEKMVDMMDLTVDDAMAEELGIDPDEFKDQMVAACNEDAGEGGEITDYEITEVEEEEDTASVTVRVTTEEDGETETEEDTLQLVKVDDEWKIALGL